MFNSQRLGLLKKWGLNSATFMQTHLCKNWKLVVNECKWWIHMVLPQNWMASCSFQMNQSGHFSSEDCKHRVAWSQGKPAAKKTMLSAGWLKRGWDVPWVSESHQIQDAMNKNARRNLEIRWLVIVAVFFCYHRIAGFWCCQHMCSKKNRPAWTPDGWLVLTWCQVPSDSMFEIKYFKYITLWLFNGAIGNQHFFIGK